MRLPALHRRLLVLAAVCAVSALHWPGVQVARADSPAPGPGEFARFERFVGETRAHRAPTADADQCNARSVPALQHAQQIEAMVRQLRRAAEARAAAQAPPGPVVVLNNRGYNYGDAPGPAAALPR